MRENGVLRLNREIPVGVDMFPTVALDDGVKGLLRSPRLCFGYENFVVSGVENINLLL